MSFGRADGMRSSECSGFTQPAGWKSHDGRLWFPTVDGAVVIDPDRIKTNMRPPPVVIEQTLHRPAPRPADGGQAEILPGRGDLEFHYTGLSFVDPDRVYFRYKLEGFDKEWIDAGTRRDAFYTNIPPGRYTLPGPGLQQRRHLERDRATPSRFRLRPHFRQTPWFYGLCAVALALAGYGVSRVCGRPGRGRARASSTAQVAERTLQLEEANASSSSSPSSTP